MEVTKQDFYDILTEVLSEVNRSPYYKPFEQTSDYVYGTHVEYGMKYDNKSGEYAPLYKKSLKSACIGVEFPTIVAFDVFQSNIQKEIEYRLKKKIENTIQQALSEEIHHKYEEGIEEHFILHTLCGWGVVGDSAEDAIIKIGDWENVNTAWRATIVLYYAITPKLSDAQTPYDKFCLDWA